MEYLVSFNMIIESEKELNKYEIEEIAKQELLEGLVAEIENYTFEIYGEYREEDS